MTNDYDERQPRLLCTEHDAKEGVGGQTGDVGAQARGGVRAGYTYGHRSPRPARTQRTRGKHQAVHAGKEENGDVNDGETKHGADDDGRAGKGAPHEQTHGGEESKGEAHGVWACVHAL